MTTTQDKIAEMHKTLKGLNETLNYQQDLIAEQARELEKVNREVPIPMTQQERLAYLESWYAYIKRSDLLNPLYNGELDKLKAENSRLKTLVTETDDLNRKLDNTIREKNGIILKGMDNEEILKRQVQTLLADKEGLKAANVTLNGVVDRLNTVIKGDSLTLNDLRDQIQKMEDATNKWKERYMKLEADLTLVESNRDELLARKNALQEKYNGACVQLKSLQDKIDGMETRYIYATLIEEPSSFTAYKVCNSPLHQVKIKVMFNP